MKGLIVRNRYYTDEGMEYVFSRLADEFGRRGVECSVCSPVLTVGRNGRPATDADGDFAVYWNKDVALCAALERQMRCFNSSETIAKCDDKLATYLALAGIAAVPRTIAAPLMYAASDATDDEFLTQVETLGYPLIVKERVGSRGEQVFLIRNRSQLREQYKRLRHTPHMYEAYIEDGERDLRVYVVGGKAVGAVTRKGAGFKSNLFAGAQAERAEPDGGITAVAERIAETLRADYCAVDFAGRENVLLEVNSNAYFTGAEQCGLNVAGALAEYIAEVTHC